MRGQRFQTIYFVDYNFYLDTIFKTVEVATIDNDKLTIPYHDSTGNAKCYNDVMGIAIYVKKCMCR